MNFCTLLLTNIGTTNSVITDTTDRYEPIITVGGVVVVGGVGGDFSHTANYAFREVTVLAYIQCCNNKREWLQCRQDGTGTDNAIVPSVAGLNTCSKPHLPSAFVAQPTALRAAMPVTGVRILSVPFYSL